MVVAAVMIDEQDRVLVNSTDGMLPMCDIASLTGGGDMNDGKGKKGSGSDMRSQKSGIESFTNSEPSVLGMDLTTGHDAFVNILKMSWSWREPTIISPQADPSIIREKQSNYAEELRRGSETTNGSTINGSSALNSNPKTMSLSVTRFIDRFAASSRELSTALNGTVSPLYRLGVLYDQILTTGWVKLHNSNDTVSKGQLIFLVRRVTSETEQTSLGTRQYIFADPQAVVSALQKTLSVPFDHAMPLLEDIRRFCDSTIRSVPKPGKVYAGVAIVQATPFDGLRVLLEKGNRAQLPMREICTIDPIARPESTAVLSSADGAEIDPFDDGLSGTLEQLSEAITWLEGMSLMSIMTRNMNVGSSQQLGGPRVTRLLQALERAVVPMLDEMLSPEDMAHILPRLYLHAVLVPLTPGPAVHTFLNRETEPTGYVPPYIITFYANYDAAVNTFTDKWLPFHLFRTQNACVMAQSIAAAASATAAATAAAVYPPESADNTNEVQPVGGMEGMYARRPSKVQFELSSLSGLSNAYAPTPSPSLSHEAGPSSGILKDFAFPPQSQAATSIEMAPLKGTAASQIRPSLLHKVSTGSSISPYSTAPVSSVTSPLSQTVTIPSDTSPPSALSHQPSNGASADRMRKSSLKVSRVEPYSAASGEKRLDDRMGIADWDPDWLLLLLRTKLRAEDA